MKKTLIICFAVLTVACANSNYFNALTDEEKAFVCEGSEKFSTFESLNGKTVKNEKSPNFRTNGFFVIDEKYGRLGCEFWTGFDGKPPSIWFKAAGELNYARHECTFSNNLESSALFKSEETKRVNLDRFTGKIDVTEYANWCANNLCTISTRTFYGSCRESKLRPIEGTYRKY